MSHKAFWVNIYPDTVFVYGWVHEPRS